MNETKTDQNAASEGTGASLCSACTELRQALQDLQDVTWDRDCLKRAMERWIDDCRRARAAVVEMMAHGARADNADMLKRWDDVQCIRIPEPNVSGESRAIARTLDPLVGSRDGGA